MTETTQHSRWLPMEGAFNVRDLGGYAAEDGQTRWGAALRADGLNRLTAADQQALLAYGVKTIIDLRHAVELQHAPNVFQDSTEVNYLHIPIIRGALPGTQGDTPDLPTIYRYFVDECQEGLRDALITIADAPEGGVLFHCSAGKDRTGVVAALLLGVAGVPVSTIVEDYTLTGIAMQKMRAFLVTEEDEARRAAQEKLMGSDAAYMAELLEYLQTKYGSFDAYLHALGLTDAHIAKFRQRILHPDTAR